MPLAGRSILEHLEVLLAEDGVSLVLITADGLRTAQRLMADCCSGALSAEKDPQAKKLPLPDGQAVQLDSARFQAPEILFDPGLAGSETPALHQLVYGAVTRCDVDRRRDMYANIVLSGGASQFPGLAERLRSNLCDLVPSGIEVTVHAAPDRSHQPWAGGSSLTNGHLKNMWVTRADYQKEGPEVVHRHCF
ncbi:hypothetical protein [Streptomyces sp. 1222.5]|uniref:hypothetical protein n=2 Tax=Streptomyces sp. 1222.5 TaxID=1881026 RepID=UPI003D722506